MFLASHTVLYSVSCLTRKFSRWSRHFGDRGLVSCDSAVSAPCGGKSLCLVATPVSQVLWVKGVTTGLCNRKPGFECCLWRLFFPTLPRLFAAPLQVTHKTDSFAYIYTVRVSGRATALGFGVGVHLLQHQHRHSCAAPSGHESLGGVYLLRLLRDHCLVS